jgi:hypothetical protein
MSARPRPPLRKRIANRVNLLRSALSRMGPGVYRDVGRYRYVFIVTYGRTGSTVLQSLIGSIPGHYMAGENNYALHGLYQSYRDCRIMREQHGTGYVPPDSPWYGGFAADPDHYARSLIESFVFDMMRPPRGAKVVGFKEIRYLAHLDDLPDFIRFMSHFFPGAKFIFNTRDVEDVSRSAWWRNADRHELGERVERLKSIMHDLSVEMPDRFVNVVYEEWSRDPEALRPMFDFLEAPFDAGRLQRILDKPLLHMKTPKAEAA